MNERPIHKTPDQRQKEKEIHQDIFSEIELCLAHLESARDSFREQETQRRYQICVTMLQKVYAFFKTFVLDVPDIGK